MAEPGMRKRGSDRIMDQIQIMTCSEDFSIFIGVMNNNIPLEQHQENENGLR
jgi:hypothetical protein